MKSGKVIIIGESESKRRGALESIFGQGDTGGTTITCASLRSMVDQILRTGQGQATIGLQDLSTIGALVIHPDLLPLNIDLEEKWGPKLCSTYSRVIQATNMRASSGQIFFQMLRDLCPSMKTKLPRPGGKIPVLLSSLTPIANNSAENELRAIQAIGDLQGLEVYKGHELGTDEEHMVNTFLRITNPTKQ